MLTLLTCRLQVPLLKFLLTLLKGEIMANDVMVKAGEALQAKPKKSLYEILELMRLRDDGMFDFEPEEMQLTAEELRNKVDDIKYIEDQFKARAAWAAEQAKEFAAIASSCTAKVKTLKNRFGVLMQQYGFDKLPGQAFQMGLRVGETIVINESVSKPDADLYRRFPDIMRRSYAWDKTAFDNAYESGKYPELKDFAFVDKRPSVTFIVKKGIK